MSRRTVKSVHLCGTAWFILCVCGILVFALRQAGVKWWVILSLSGYSVTVFFLLVSLYLVAVFRGAARSRKTEIEHPLTSSVYYMLFYYLSPFFGGLAGSLSMSGMSRVGYELFMVAFGTFVMTFVVWIILDPALAMAEMMLPESRRHWLSRRTQARMARKEVIRQRELMLAEVQAQDETDRWNWRDILGPESEKLARLAADGSISSRQVRETRTETIEIGIKAWQVGGLRGMREVFDKAAQLYAPRMQEAGGIDRISQWWDGIGNWRSLSLDEQ